MLSGDSVRDGVTPNPHPPYRRTPGGRIVPNKRYFDWLAGYRAAVGDLKRQEGQK